MSRSLTSGAPAGLAYADRPPRGQWVHDAIATLVDEDVQCPETAMSQLLLAGFDGVEVHLKDEAAHPTGSLKHRLARSLVLFGLCNGWIHEGTTLVEASSGSTAVSEAWFAKLLGLPFVAVLPETTSPEKVELIRGLGGDVAFVNQPEEIYDAAARIAQACGGHYLDQFTYAERATDWRGNNNIAESLLAGMRGTTHPVPAWIVVGAGTGGTAATIGRYLRYRGLATQLCLVDPEASAYYPSWHGVDASIRTDGSAIEGIGRPRSEPSFIPTVIDRAIRVPDAASVAAMHWLHRTTGQLAGPSTGTNLIGALLLARQLHDLGQDGSVVTLLCDRGDRYAGTYFNDAWVAGRGWDLKPWTAWLQEFAS